MADMTDAENNAENAPVAPQPEVAQPLPDAPSEAQKAEEVAPPAPAMTAAPEPTEPAAAAAAAEPAQDAGAADAPGEKDPAADGGEEAAAGEPDEAEAEDENMDYHSDSGSEFQPEPESPKPKNKAARTPKTPKTPAAAAAAAAAAGAAASGAAATKTPKTPLSRVRSGRVEKTGSVTPSLSPGPQQTLRCPVKGCGQTFTGRNPRQSLWHHLKYYATRGLPDKQEFEKAHGDAHLAMKREAEPKGTPVERNRISSADYRKKNPEKAKTSARLSNFRARARKKGLTGEKEIEDMVNKWEKEWQEKQAKEASEYFSGILLSAFE